MTHKPRPVAGFYFPANSSEKCLTLAKVSVTMLYVRMNLMITEWGLTQWLSSTGGNF